MYICKNGFTSFGYAFTLDEPIVIVNGFKYKLIDVNDKLLGGYCEVIPENEDKIITTISLSEKKIFFEEIKKEG
jgi:hypothetical protein